MLAIGFAKYGNEAELQKNPIKHLFDIYVKINKDIEAQPELNDQAKAYFVKMEAGDAGALSLWKKFRDLSISEYKNIYKRLNTEFDVYSGESFYGQRMESEFKKLSDKGLIQISQGASVVDLKVSSIKNVSGERIYLFIYCLNFCI